MTDKKTLNLDALRRSNAKREVGTCLGPLYVRHLALGDYKKIVSSGSFEKAGERGVGLQALQATTSLSQDPGMWEGLSDEDFSKLKISDLDALAAAALDVAGYPVAEDLVAGLGRGMLDQYAELGKAHEKILEQFRRSFSFLQPETLQSLTASVAAIDQSNQKWKDQFSEIWKNPIAGPAAGTLESLRPPDLKLPLHTVREDTLPTIDYSRTYAARAATASEEAVDVLEKLATHMGEVHVHTASMYKTLVLEAIPQWIAQQHSNKEQSELSLRGAASSLRWTKWAVIISIITSVGIAWYQQYRGSIDAEVASRQANERQAYWEKQSATQQALLNTQIQATQNLQAELKSLNALLGKSNNPKVPALRQTNAKPSKKHEPR